MDHRLAKKKQTPREQQLGYEGGSHVPPSGDPDAEAYFAAAGITDTTEKTAVTTAIEDLKTAAIWPKLIYLYLCSPTSLAAALVNAKTAVSATNSGATHSSSGLATGGSNFFYGTEFDFGTLPSFDFHASIYTTDLTTADDRGLIGYKYTGVAADVWFGMTGFAGAQLKAGYGKGTAQQATSTAITAGHYLMNTESSTTLSLTRSGVDNFSNVFATTSPSGFSYPDNKFAIGNCYTYSDSSFLVGITTTVKTATAGYRLTSQQKTDLISIISVYNTALGRN